MTIVVLIAPARQNAGSLASEGEDIDCRVILGRVASAYKMRFEPRRSILHARPMVLVDNCAVEARRIGLLLERDGRDATRDWVTRTLGIYRRAVLDPSHFASKAEYRRMYLASCVDFRRWLRMNRA